jgi:hypothetical protein
MILSACSIPCQYQIFRSIEVSLVCKSILATSSGVIRPAATLPVTPNPLRDSSGSSTNDGPVQDTQSADMRTYTGESMDLPRMGGGIGGPGEHQQRVLLEVRVNVVSIAISRNHPIPD